jgi:hypothetical protein
VGKSIRNVAHAFTVQASAGRQVSNLFNGSLTHGTPLLSAVSMTNAPGTGSTSITVIGSNYGGYQYSLSLAKLRIGVS